MPRPLRIALVAGEASGDLLGAGLIRAIRERHPGARFAGVAGPRMAAEGCEVVAPMERLAVMGLVEVLGRLPGLLHLRRRLRDRLLAARPDVFVGIDAPEFNLGLEAGLRAAGIPVVHYVSPSVWAWRSGRIRRIRRACDRMLTLLPFEARFYRQAGVPVSFVGHPLADRIRPAPPGPARQALGLAGDGPVLTLMPGSRGGEVDRLGEVFLAAAGRLSRRMPGLCCVIPTVHEAHRRQLEALAARTVPGMPVLVRTGDAGQAIAAADAVLVASGTATLEVMLAGRPMVVGYRLSPLSYRILRRLVRVPRVSLPNLLADRLLVPELLQDACTPQALAEALMPLLRDPAARARQCEAFRGLGSALARDADRRAAEAVLATARGWAAGWAAP